VVVGVDARPAVIKMRWWDPFGDAVLVFPCGPALFGQWVVAAAAERQIVDVGGAALGVGRDVVNFGEVARDIAIGKRAAAVLGVEHYSLTG
jgi:hypothetical protein